MRTAVVYYSKHHENTKKLLDAIKDASSDEITLFDVTKTAKGDLSDFLYNLAEYRYNQIYICTGRGRSAAGTEYRPRKKELSLP